MEKKGFKAFQNSKNFEAPNTSCLKETEIGLIPEDWEIKAFSEIVDIIGGGTPKTSVPEYWDGDIPWLSVVDFNNDFRTVDQTEKSISELGLKNSSTKILKKGDIIISARGTVGAIAQLGKDMAFNQSCYGLKAKNELTNNDFVYYLLKYSINNLKQTTHGSTFDTITTNTFDLIKVPFPPFIEQKAMSKILSSIDSKIELNHKMNHTLEKIGQAIFKHWFIDFEFPNEDGKPYKSSGGEMVDSELGEVPEGWEAGKLRDILSIEIGGDWGKDEEFDDSVKVICLRGVDLQKLKENGYSPEAPVRWISKSSLLKREISNCDILVGASGLGPVGRSIYFSSYINNLYDYPIIYSNFCKRLKAKNSAYAMYSEKIIDTIHSSGQIEDFVTGTSVPNLDFKGLLNYEIVIPPENILEQYASILNQKYKQLYKSENNILSQIRDSLLPKLMSGKIRLKGSETRENRKNINKRDQIPLKHEIHS